MCCNQARPRPASAYFPHPGHPWPGQRWQSDVRGPNDPTGTVRPQSATHRHPPNQPGCACNPGTPGRSSPGAPYMSAAADEHDGGAWHGGGRGCPGHRPEPDRGGSGADRGGAVGHRAHRGRRLHRLRHPRLPRAAGGVDQGPGRRADLDLPALPRRPRGTPGGVAGAGRAPDVDRDTGPGARRARPARALGEARRPAQGSSSPCSPRTSTSCTRPPGPRPTVSSSCTAPTTTRCA
jgi:hypothetical protein